MYYVLCHYIYLVTIKNMHNKIRKHSQVGIAVPEHKTLIDGDIMVGGLIKYLFGISSQDQLPEYNIII